MRSKKTRVVRLGNLLIGGNHPVCIKGMLKTPVAQKQKFIAEAKLLEKEGAQALRIAVKEEKDAATSGLLKKHISLPLVADVHFHYRTALAAIESGFDGIRLNPLNINKRSEVAEVVRAAKRRKISIRVGINSGGFKKKFASSGSMAEQMVRAAGEYVRMLEREDFFDIMVSLKGADVDTTVLANRIFAGRFDYPLHLGVTASGPFLDGVIKSSLGLGMLLSQGIGSVIRISLTAPSFWEIRVAKRILQALKLRNFGPEIISCPTCSRCEVDLIDIVNKFEKDLRDSGLDKPLRIALMGCVVNGPGEAAQADIGAAFGKNKAAIFCGDKVLRVSDEKRVVRDLWREIKKRNKHGI